MKRSTRMADMPLVAVLAAGRATRFGGGKLEVPCAGKPLGRWAIEAVEAAGLGQGLIVTGPEGVSFAPDWTPLANAHPEQGLGTSLAIAARHARALEAPALLILLADMPLVTPAYLRQLTAAQAPAATRHPDDHPGVPAWLDSALIAQAADLTADRGAGPLLSDVALLDPPPGTLHDVDTPEDLTEAERQLSAR